ncbi:MAG TPA: hypothetical protein VFA78_03155 [Chloroflexota bacterium]|nr:hypothetical protein [Chloroflexota bacterium]
MNDDERRRILRMVAEGKVSAEEAADLLDALQEPRPAPEPERSYAELHPYPVSPVPPVPQTDQVRGRALVIRISEGDENSVNLRIPLGLAKAAGKFLPRRAEHDLREHGIDLPAVFDGVSSGVEVGPLLMIQDGGDTVYIGVE